MGIFLSPSSLDDLGPFELANRPIIIAPEQSIAVERSVQSGKAG
jgi:hypothetical protein